MTIEQKAKAYDEALERARAFNNGEDVDIEAGTTFCEYIFPELKESEDERIRRAIYNALKYLESELSWDFLDDVDILDAYEWLEKQDEQKLTEITKEEIINKAYEWIENNKHFYKELSFGGLSTDWDKFSREFRKAMEE